MNEEDNLVRPHQSRRRHQEALARQRRRRRHRRLVRVRRIRFWKTIRSIRFWTRFMGFIVTLLLVVFWAKFAFILNIPDYAKRGVLSNVSAYVTVKPWWFGPPVFDLSQYEYQSQSGKLINHPYDMLLTQLGKYKDVVDHPNIIWDETN